MRLSSAARGIALFAAIGSMAALSSRAAADVVDAELELGGRVIHGDFDSSKFEEYRDIEPGVFGDGNFLLEDADGKIFFRGNLENVGYDDQRYSVETGRWGKFRFTGEYAELPHVFSNEARTLYSLSGSDQLLLPDALQQAIQFAPANACGVPTLAPPAVCGPIGKSALLGYGSAAVAQPGSVPGGGYVPNANQPAAPFPGLADAQHTPLRYRVRTGKAGMVFNPREDVEIELGYRSLGRDGTRPFGMGFGSPGGNFANFARPVDERTEELTGDLRLGRGPWNLEVGYLASFFNNELKQLIADNPVRLTDTSSASSRGRISLAPDNSLISLHTTAGYQLPSEFPARVTASFAYGIGKQDDEFLPHTINSTLASDPLLVLPRKGLNGEVQTIMGNLLVTARPLPELDLRARYRYYQHDNRTPGITFDAHTINDQGLATEPRRNITMDFERQQASLDASYRILPELHLRGGPFWEQMSRSSDREVSTLNEFGGKLALDYRPTSWAVLRADYLLGFRDGSQYKPYDFYYATFVDPQDAADAVTTGQLAQLRKFDEANRNRHEIKALAQLIPRNDLDVSFSAGWTQYDYPDSSFGVRDDARWNIGSELTYAPIESLSISLWYDYEHSDLHQRSRWRPVGGVTVVDDPANNWDSSSGDQIHALGANLDFAIVKDKLDFSLDYTYENGNGATRSSAAPGCVNAGVNPACLPTPGGGADGGAAVDFPDIEDALQMLDATLSFHQSEHLTFEARYSWQKLHLQDYRIDGLNPYMPDSNVNGSGVISPSTDVFLGEQIPDYNAHIIAFTAIYNF